ncbi:MAG: hypothetical protein IKT52_11235 [Oscillospiraceae bacterium]|nr:hypothetical protein [Oscillospiraceae bacterium]
MYKIRFLCIFLTVLLLLTACTSNAPEPSLYDRGLEVIALMHDAINSDAYLDMLSANEDMRTIIDEAAAGDYNAPAAAYSISFMPDALNAVGDLSALPETLLDTVSHRLISAVTTQVNAFGGVEILAASTMCTVGKTFVCSELKEDIIYLYVFENGCPVAVTFTGGEDQTVCASANVIFYEDFPTSDAQSIQEFFGDKGVTVTDISRK